MATLASYSTDTGFRAPDAVRFSQPVRATGTEHRDTSIVMCLIKSHGSQATMTDVDLSGDHPDLLFLSRGSGVQAAGRIADNRFDLAPSRAIRTTFVPAGADMHMLCGSQSHSINFFFPPGFLQALAADQNGRALAPLIFASDERLHQLIRLLECEVAAPGFASKLMIEGLARSLAAMLAQINEHELAAVADRIFLAPAKLRRVIEFVDHSIEEDIALADMAAIAGLSTFHFSRVFKRATGSSPYHFVRERRLELSRKLLVETDMGIAELALVCGFANQSHFTAAFSRAMGISPARYRQLMRN